MNIRRITVPILCLLLFLLSFTGVVHGAYTIYDEDWSLSPQSTTDLFYLDLPAGDSITISIQVYGSTIDFYIANGTDALYEKPNILTLEDVWNVPAEGTYTFQLSLTDVFTYSNGHILLQSEIIPEFPIWTSMLLVLITLTIAIIIFKRRIFKTQIH